ncbi:hypothetical protein FRC08_016244, partial [Ceratobasidium sp. 394]
GDGGESDSEGETPESSEPATEGDIELEAIACVSGIKRKLSFPGVGAGDGTIQVTKKVNGVVGVHSASDDEEDEEEAVV